MILLKIAFILGIIIFVWASATRKFINPYKLRMVIGKKGNGKSTIETMLSYNGLYPSKRNYSAVYSTEDHVFRYRKWDNPFKYHYEEKHTIVIDPRKLPQYKLKENSLLLLDEVGTIWHSRSFKSHDMAVTRWFKYQRKKKVEVWLFSQTFDIDKSIRDLVDEFYICHKFARVLVWYRRLIMKPVVVHPQGDSAARLADDFVEDNLFSMLFAGGLKFCWIPKYSNMFDTNYIPDSDIGMLDPEGIKLPTIPSSP